MTDARPPQTPGVKIQYLIRRRTTTSRDELIAHWFANHMPSVIARNEANRTTEDPAASHYVASLFQAEDAAQGWDGVAQLWYDAPLPYPTQASGVVPADTFHEKVEPYWPWNTHEWVVLDGALPLEVPTLNAPFPCTRSGFLKQISLVAAKPGVDVGAMFDHWLDVHIPNVRETMRKVGGFRYVVSLSTDLDRAPYAGMAELYFPDLHAQAAFWDAIESDGFEAWADASATVRVRCDTEMVGIE